VEIEDISAKTITSILKVVFEDEKIIYICVFGGFFWHFLRGFFLSYLGRNVYRLLFFNHN
jgi:hypothetical protein